MTRTQYAIYSFIKQYITKEKISILQEADNIFIQELIKANLYDKVSQAFAVLLPVKSVGVVGDERRYADVIAS